MEDVVVDLLIHRHGYAVDADLEGDSALRGCPHIAAIGTHASTRHSEKGWILAFFYRHAQDAVCTIVLLHVLEAHLVDVHILRAPLGQQSLRGIQLRLASLLDGVLPERLEVLRHHRRGLQLLRREGGTAGLLVVLAVHMGRHVDTVEAGLLHRTCQFQRTVLQHHAFLDILVHLRASLVVDAYIINKCTRLAHLHREGGLFARRIGPVLMVRLYRHHNVVATNLSR